SRSSPGSGHIVGPTSCLVKLRCGVKSPSEVSQWLGLPQIDHPQDGSCPQVRRAVVEQDILVVPGGYSCEGHGGISRYAPGTPGSFYEFYHCSELLANRTTPARGYTPPIRTSFTISGKPVGKRRPRRCSAGPNGCLGTSCASYGVPQESSTSYGLRIPPP